MSNDTDTLNGQIKDALEQLNASLPGMDRAFMAAASYQAIAHALALRLHNAVAQQQHDHMLRTALTSAAASALLDGKKEEAEAVLALAESKLVKPSISEEITELRAALGALGDELRKMHSANPPAPAPA
ncbi:MAG TPA: RebB family R body protein [Opitutaceae bacterium]|jgi:hypothetical protein|nr:RebB family R body protein [Opitutaceae bacterium]